MNHKEMVMLEKKTQEVYERNGSRFDRERPKTLFEKNWLNRFRELLPPDAKILDVGCGAGEPIAQYFIEQGLDLTGVDFSQSMLDIARSRFPDNQWHLMDMRKLDLKEQFDGIIAWHSFFHLTPDDQRTTLVKFSQHLVPGGALMLTVGDEEGEVVGNVGDDKVYHSSLSLKEYTELLSDHNIEIVRFVPNDPECSESTILLARKMQAV